MKKISSQPKIPNANMNNLYTSENTKTQKSNLKFELELLKQKLSSSENTIKNYVELQKEYEKRYNTLLKDQKSKEEETKKLFKQKEDLLIQEKQSKQKDYEKKVEQMKEEIDKLKQELILTKTKTEKLSKNPLSPNLFTNLFDKDCSSPTLEKETIISELKSEIKEQNEKIQMLSAQNDQLSRISRNQSRKSLNEILFSPIIKVEVNSYKDVKENLPKENVKSNMISLYDFKKVQELRNKISSFEEERDSLSSQLNLKQKEIDSLNKEIYKYKEIIKNNQKDIREQENAIQEYKDNILKQQSKMEKDLKFSNLEKLISNYGNNIISLKESYQEALEKHHNDLNELSKQYEDKIQKIIEENLSLKKALEISKSFENKGQRKNVIELHEEKNNSNNNQKFTNLFLSSPNI